jgi:hypothetical protein
MTFITHGFRVSVVSDVRDLGSPLRFMLRRSSLVECEVVPNISRPKKSRLFLMHWMSVKLPDNFHMPEYSWPCRFHIIYVCARRAAIVTTRPFSLLCKYLQGNENGRVVTLLNLKRAVVPLFELSFLAKSQKLTSA